jgi:hypothetical protein
MRADLNKLLCERARHRSDDHFTNYRHLKHFDTKVDDDGDAYGGRESMKKRYQTGWSTKELNENLNPLFGAIRKAVGRPWNKFYSDLCKSFDKRSVINQHILEHLYSYIEVKGMYIGEDGKPWVRGHYSDGNEPIAGSAFRYYVDPRDGIIKANVNRVTYKQRNAIRAAKEKAAEDAVKRVIDDKNVLHLQNGVWYHYTVEPVPESTVTYGPVVTRTASAAEYIYHVQVRYGREVVQKTWKELNERERSLYGRMIFSQPLLTDVFTGHYVRNCPKYGNNFVPNDHRVFSRTENRKFYHATKKTASKKILKLAGLI